LTCAICGSIFVSYGSGQRGAADQAAELGLRLAAARAISTRSDTAARLNSGHLASASVSVRRGSTDAEDAAPGSRCQGRLYGQTPSDPGRSATSLRRNNRANAEPDRQSGLRGSVPARGAWLSGRRPHIECSWSIAVIVCNRRSSGKPISYSCQSDKARLRTTPRR
jgi:hypothetical protein